VDGLLRLADGWTASGTWWVFVAASCIAAAVLVLRAAHFARRLAAGDAGARHALAASCALFAVALALRWLWPERVHYTFNDEYEYVAYARRLLATHAYGLPTSPPAGVFLYALASALLGASTGAVFAATIVAASLTPPALAWALRVLGVERRVALLAALLLALAPLHVKHSASASLEVLSLLLVLLAVGTFVELLRAPRTTSSLAFAASLFFALTVRVENWALLAMLPLLWWLWRDEARALSPASLVWPCVAALLAAAYLPGIVVAPIRYDPWWKSALPAPSLLATNLAFWVGGDAATRKLPLVVAAVGLAAGLRARTRMRAMLFWLAFLIVYSVVYVLYGLNVGWLEEAHQPAPWGARGAGHDMFRFNVVLLAPVVLLLAYGVDALARGAVALWRGNGPFASWPAPRRAAAGAAALALCGALLAWRGEYAAYHPLGFVASRYNRGYEIAEFLFLRDAVAAERRGVRLYVAPPAEGVALGELDTRPLAELPQDLERGGAPALLYVSGRQLAVPGVRDALTALGRRYELQEVARRSDGRDTFQLFAVRAHAAAAAQP